MVEKKAQMGDFIGFSFNGIHSSELGLVRVSDGNRYEKNLFPAISDKTVQVPGRDGFYYFGSSYNTREMTIKVAFDNLEEKDFRKMVEHFKDKKPHFLWFDELPYKEYLVKIKSPPNFKYLCFDEWVNDLDDNGDYQYEDGQIKQKLIRCYKGEGTIVFVCYSPYARARAKSLSDPVDKVIVKNEENYLDLIHNHYLDGNNNDDMSGEFPRNNFKQGFLDLKTNFFLLEDQLKEKFCEYYCKGTNQLDYFFSAMGTNNYGHNDYVEILRILFFLKQYFGYTESEEDFFNINSNYSTYNDFQIAKQQEKINLKVAIELFNGLIFRRGNEFEDSGNNVNYNLKYLIEGPSGHYNQRLILLILYYLFNRNNFQKQSNTQQIYNCYNSLFKVFAELNNITLNESTNLANFLSYYDINQNNTFKQVELNDFYNIDEWKISSGMPESRSLIITSPFEIVNCGDIDMNTKILLSGLDSGECTVELKLDNKTINSITINCNKLQEELERRKERGKDHCLNKYEYFFLDSKTKLLQAYDTCSISLDTNGQPEKVNGKIQYYHDDGWQYENWESDKETTEVFNNCLTKDDFFKIPADNLEYTIEVTGSGNLVGVEYTYLYY